MPTVAEELAKLSNRLDAFATQRERTTGYALARPEVDRWPPDFAGLVSKMYQLFWEAWGSEIRCLTRLMPYSAKGRTVDRFLKDLNAIRQSQQHNHTEQHDRDVRSWLRDAANVDVLTSETDAAAGKALIGQAIDAVFDLTGLAKEISSDTKTAAAWSRFVGELVGADPFGALQELAGDWGLRLGNPEWLQRTAKERWESRLRSLNLSDDRDLHLQNVVGRILLSQFTGALPCDYADVLDALELEPGTRRAFGAALMAHGLAEMSTYETADEFLSLVEAMIRPMLPPV